MRRRIFGKPPAAWPIDPDRESRLSSIVQEACRITEFERCAVLLLDKTGERLCPASVHPPELSPEPDCARFPLSLALVDTELTKLTALDKPVYLENVLLPDSLWRMGDREGSGRPIMIVPLTSDGTTLGLAVFARPLRDKLPTELDLDAAALLGIHMAAAVTHPRTAETGSLQLFEILARGKREWEQTVDAISDGILISNAEHVVMRTNRAFAAMFGKHPREIVGKKCHDLIWGNPSPCDHCIRASLLAAPDAPLTGTPMECVISGSTLEVTAYGIEGYEGRLSAVVHIFEDVTEQRRMQDLVIRSERIRAIGEMASGVAHDFNNVLSSIIGWSEVMMLSDLQPHLKECADAINQAALDGTEIVKRIQEYTRIRKDTKFTSVDINEVVRGSIELARPRLKNPAQRGGIAIDLVTEFAEIPPASGNASDLREVFLNIILNAIDAMPEGGDIRIRTGRREANVFASISDSGTGMSEEVLGRAFDPFFTTKGSAGSGLGLSIAFGIVSRHGGELSAQSTPGVGSTFTVVLPVASEVEVAHERGDAPLKRAIRVLLVDDDERVLRATEAMLRSEGHVVTICSGGKQSMEVLGQAAYDLVITDLGMPEMNGWEVAARVRAISPGTRVLLLTGWGAEIAAERLSEAGIDGVIQKPCRLPGLRQAIDDVLKPKVAEARVSPVVDRVQADGTLRIVLIDDNRSFGEALKQRLEIDGHLVKLACSGREGLAAVRERDTDLVLSDLKLGDISGIEVAEIIEKKEQRPFVAIMTGDPRGLDPSLLQKGGIDAVLRKPWKDPELRGVLDRVLKGRGGV
ncbi:MAG: response regulator [Chloroflexi bacterium]|nr:response regulator [Chloroflexota bacterium]